MDDWLLSVTEFTNEYGVQFPGTCVIELRMKNANSVPLNPPFETIRDLLVHVLDSTDLDQIDNFIAMGSVYHRSHNTNASFNRMRENCSLSVISLSDPLRKTKMKIPNGVFRGFCALRVHQNPKLFLRSGEINWKKRLIVSNEDLLIFDKPSGVPCEPHMSNLRDCVHISAKNQLNLPDAYCLNRLDLQTSGLVAVATSKSGAEKFNKVLRNETNYTLSSGLAINQQEDEVDYKEDNAKRRKVKDELPAQIKSLEKRYRVLTKQPIDLSLIGVQLTHYTPPGAYNGLTCPRMLSTIPHSEWKKCVLVVNSCKKLDSVHIIDTAVEHEHMENAVHGENYRKFALEIIGNDKGIFYESVVTLLTGRTHQIRLQFALGLSNPLVGDLCYEKMTGRLVESLSGDDHDNLIKLAKSCEDLNDKALIIGLQSAYLNAPEIGLVDIEAPVPWWRGGNF